MVDYPREALVFLAESEAIDPPPDVRITPIRQEQLQERLGEPFRELDTPLLIAQETQVMTTYLQQVRQECLQEGRQEGRREGEQRGEARILLRLVRLKFGEIPEDVRRRIEAADADTLLAWSERILSAEGIADIVR